MKTDRFSVDEIIGRTVVIHSGPDDFRTQPAGNAGKTIACGVTRDNNLDNGTKILLNYKDKNVDCLTKEVRQPTFFVFCRINWNFCNTERTNRHINHMNVVTAENQNGYMPLGLCASYPFFLSSLYTSYHLRRLIQHPSEILAL